MRALITQREDRNRYGNPTDVLEIDYIRFYEKLGLQLQLQPVSNFTCSLRTIFKEHWDLLVVVGGGALNPEYYDRPHNEERQYNRDAIEEFLIRYCLDNQVPIVGTCRGMQHINALLGGSLTYHPNYPVNRPLGTDHMVHFLKEDKWVQVNNYHYDCIYREQLAPGLIPLAMDEENSVVEAFTNESGTILGVQWHPERYVDSEEDWVYVRDMIRDFIRNGHIEV